MKIITKFQLVAFTLGVVYLCLAPHAWEWDVMLAVTTAHGCWLTDALDAWIKERKAALELQLAKGCTHAK